MKITILPFNIENISKSYEFILDTFQISFGNDKLKWPNNLGNYSLEKFNSAMINILKKDPEAIFSVWATMHRFWGIESFPTFTARRFRIN